MRPQPLRNVALGAAGVGYAVLDLIDRLVDLAVELGMDARFSDDLSGIGEAAVLLLVAVGFWKFGQHEVTPLSDPRDAQDRPLVPAGELDVAVGTAPTVVPTETVSVRPADQPRASGG